MKDLYTNAIINNYEEGQPTLDRQRFSYKVSKDDKVYNIKQGDTLQSIAHKFYGNSKYWYVIADVNEILNPLLLNIGEQLIIPKILDRLI